MCVLFRRFVPPPAVRISHVVPSGYSTRADQLDCSAHLFSFALHCLAL